MEGPTLTANQPVELALLSLLVSKHVQCRSCKVRPGIAVQCISAIDNWPVALKGGLEGAAVNLKVRLQSRKYRLAIT